MDYLILNGNKINVEKDRLYINGKVQSATLGRVVDVAGCKIKLLYDAIEIVEINSHKLVVLDECGESVHGDVDKNTQPYSDNRKTNTRTENTKNCVVYSGDYEVNGINENIIANLIVDGVVEVNGMQNTIIQTSEPINGIPTWHITGNLEVNGVSNTIKYVNRSKNIRIYGVGNRLQNI